jgi:2-polyprenyl-3-methyl-5-hydroxy-6-metoxy-1,4-benzoquinol methylase
MTTRRVHEHCLLCESTALQPLKGYERCALVRCRGCGFVFVQWIATDRELKEHYTRTYADNTDSYEWLSPVTSKRFNQWLDRFEPSRRMNRMLDVGCGVGHFLTHAKDRGWEVYGTEYPDNAVATCRAKGITMHAGPLDAANYPPESFDVITWLGVVEHITNPGEDLAKMSRLLRPGGLLYLTTPNFDALSRLLLRSRWNVISYPEHLSYYTASALTRLLERHGFRKRTIEATGFSVSRLTASLNEKPVKYVSPTCTDERIRVALESRRALVLAKRLVNALLTVTRKGDELTLTFEKA